jgi:hypothetical protein
MRWCPFRGAGPWTKRSRGQGQRRQNSVQGILRMAIDEDFISGGRNAQTRGVIVMGRAAGLPLVPVLPGLRTAVRNGCG